MSRWDKISAEQKYCTDRNIIERRCPINKYTGWLREKSGYSYNNLSSLGPSTVYTTIVHDLLRSIPVKTNNKHNLLFNVCYREEMEYSLDRIFGFIFKTKKASAELAESVNWAESLLPIIEYDFQNELHKEFAHMDKGLQECYAWYSTVWLKSYRNARVRKPVVESLKQARIKELEDELSSLTGIDYRRVRMRRERVISKRGQ